LANGLSPGSAVHRGIQHVPPPQRLLDDDRPVPERRAVDDLHALVVFAERAVQPGDLVDLPGADLAPRLAQRLAHLHEARARVDELHFAAALLGLAVGQQPDVRSDARVVEELLGQRDDRL
jgi:hypothetical protein